MEVLKRIARMCRPHAKFALIGFVALLAANATRLILPLISGWMVDDVIKGGQMGKLMPLCGAILVLTVLRAVSNYIRGVSFEKLSQNFCFDLRTGLYRHLSEMSYHFYDTNYIGEIMSRMINDTRQMELLIAHSLPDMATNVMVIVGVCIMIFQINWRLAIFTLLPVLIILLLSRVFITKVAPLFKINQEVLAGLNANTQDNLSGMKEIQAFGKEGAESLRMRDYCKKYAFVNIRANFYNAMYHPTVEFMTSIGTVIVMGVGGVLAMHGSMDTADIVGFFMYLSLFYTPLSTLARLAEDIQVSNACAVRVLELLDTDSEVREDPDAVEIPRGNGEVVFSHVTFGYDPSVKVLDDVSFTCKPGQMIALVGATGEGKTTIISLLERFYDPLSGAILLDGSDIRHATLHSLRDNLSIVLQDVFLFNGTVFENIAYGAENVSEAEVYAAAKVACADEFIRAMPEGYNTRIGERGVRLSGGQKQRIAIARAVLRNTPVLILDEATSAVDNETEAQIQKAIENLAGKHTLIVIAHRLTTIMKADNILVLKDGKIAESGTHTELMAKGGLYHDMTSVNQSKIGI